MPDSLPSTLTSLLALEDASPACHEFGYHLLDQISSLEGLQSLLPDPDALSALEFTEIHFPDQKSHVVRSSRFRTIVILFNCPRMKKWRVIFTLHLA